MHTLSYCPDCNGVFGTFELSNGAIWNKKNNRNSEVLEPRPYITWRMLSYQKLGFHLDPGQCSGKQAC